MEVILNIWKYYQGESSQSASTTSCFLFHILSMNLSCQYLGLAFYSILTFPNYQKDYGSFRFLMTICKRTLCRIRTSQNINGFYPFVRRLFLTSYFYRFSLKSLFLSSRTFLCRYFRFLSAALFVFHSYKTSKYYLAFFSYPNRVSCKSHLKPSRKVYNIQKIFCNDCRVSLIFPYSWLTRGYIYEKN